MAMSSLEVSIATGAPGPVLVLAGEADVTSITRLDEALTAQIAGQAVQLTIDAANLRYADSASMRTLVMAAMKVRTRAGSVTLLDPQPPVARLLDLLRIVEMFSIRRRAADETHPDTSAADGRPGGGPPGRSDNSRSIFRRTGLASRHRWPAPA
jgi:anti-anti-sigma factor